jgi:hypothetical protein
MPENCRCSYRICQTKVKSRQARFELGLSRAGCVDLARVEYEAGVAAAYSGQYLGYAGATTDPDMRFTTSNRQREL